MFHAFFAVIPVFCIIGFGVLLRARDVLPENAGPVIGVYVLKVSLPLLILHLLAGANPDDLARGGFWLALIGSQLVVYALGYVGDRLFCRRGTGPAVISGLSCSACNAAFVGLPIVYNLWPGNNEAMLVAGLAILTPNVVMILAQARLDLLAGSLAWKGGSALNFVGSLLRIFILGNPILLATLFGAVLSVSRLGLWEPLDSAISLVGFTAAPCMLLALGLDLRQKLAVATRRAQGGVVPRQIWFVVCKLVLHPLLCWGIMYALGITGLWLTIPILISATATALLVSVIAQVYSAVPEEAALTAVVSNGVSIVTLTGFVWLFSVLGML
ncbi:MAG: AEC family transporter [Desulfovibrio sp.]|nr:AEC family transporter [Desulfovibrio sp.]